MEFSLYPPQASSADEVTNTPAGNISATNVQSAINELDAEKADLNYVTNYPPIPSATTTDIFGAAGATISIDNSTPVTTTDFADCTAAQVGSVKRVIPVQDWTVTASANMTVDGATSGNFVMPAGARLEVLAKSTTTFDINTVESVQAYSTVLTTQGGPFANATATMRVVRRGRMVNVSYTIAITDDLGAYGMIMLTVPYAAKHYALGIARENSAIGTINQAWIAPDENLIRILNAANGYAGGDGYSFIGSISYMAT